MELKQILKQNELDFCIVGNSPKELGKRNGRRIDGHKVVIRFNDFSTDRRFVTDYGSKTSVWIRGSSDNNMYTLEEKKKILNQFDLIVIRAKRRWSKNFRSYMDSNDLEYCIFPIEYEIELSKKLGFSPSTGMLTLFYIVKNFGKIHRNRVYGFSFCKENRGKDKAGQQVHYYNRGDLVNPRSGKVEKIKKTFLSSRHNWALEEEFFNKEIIL